MNKGILYIFSGLPAVGKSTLAAKLASFTSSVWLRIDTMEQGLRDICGMSKIDGMGYRLSYETAKDNLNIGNSVVADSVNPWKLTRNEWNEVAVSAGVNFINIEVICSDSIEHRFRVENRYSDIRGLKLPTWKHVKDRDYHNWDSERIVIDTANKNIEESFRELLDLLSLV